MLDADIEDQPDLPARRRRSTPATVAIGAVLVAALGFIGGVLVQKGQQDDTPTGGARMAAAGATAGAGPGGRRAQQQQGGSGAQTPTAGEVKTKNGRTLYVEDGSGNTVKVRLGAQSKVVRTAGSSARRIHPGDTVIIQGAKGANGTVKATSVTATAAGTSSGGFPGGGMPGGGLPGGGTPGGSAGSGGIPAGPPGAGGG